MCRKCHPNLRVSVRCEEHRPDVGITPMAEYLESKGQGTSPDEEANA